MHAVIREFRKEAWETLQSPRGHRLIIQRQSVMDYKNAPLFKHPILH